MVGKSQAINSRIVWILEQYGQIPEGFLAQQMARRTPEIEEILVQLEERGVVTRDNGNVSLAKSG
jgi:hypothetical protein